MAAWNAEKFVIADFPITEETNTYFSYRNCLEKGAKHNYVKTILCFLHWVDRACWWAAEAQNMYRYLNSITKDNTVHRVGYYKHILCLLVRTPFSMALLLTLLFIVQCHTFINTVLRTQNSIRFLYILPKWLYTEEISDTVFKGCHVVSNRGASFPIHTIIIVRTSMFKLLWKHGEMSLISSGSTANTIHTK
jgi:hypothetical protein